MNKNNIESVALTLFEMVEQWDDIKDSTKISWINSQINTLKKEKDK